LDRYAYSLDHLVDGATAFGDATSEVRIACRLDGELRPRPPKAGTVEGWARAADNPVGGWYGLKRACGAASAATCHR
jgi:hypothetical protein